MRSAPAARALVLLPLLASTTVLLLAALGWQSASVNAFQPPSPTASGSRRRHHRSLLQTPSRSASISHQASSLPSPWALAAQQSSSGGGGGMEGLFRLIRNDALSLAIGSLCLVALVGNRLGTPDLYDSQSRTDIIGVISAGGLLLNGLTLQDVAVREAEAVELQGEAVDEVDTSSGGVSARQGDVLRWAADTYMRAFPSVDSVLVWHQGRTLLRKGVMPPAAASATKGAVEVLPIVQKALTQAPEPDGLSQPTYVPDLQVLPGRVEFVNYLPALCQAVLLQPFDDNRGLVILGGNRKRDLTPKDLARARVVAQKVQSCVVTTTGLEG